MLSAFIRGHVHMSSAWTRTHVIVESSAAFPPLHPLRSTPLPPPRPDRPVMSYLVRVVKGNLNEAVRQLNRHAQTDGHAKLAQRYKANTKPCQARRQARQTSIRRHHKSHLLQNLRVVFARKARGF